MSLWGATVITNLLSAIPVFGQDLVELIWGGFSVSNATLNRFFSLHFLLPFLLAALAIAHLMALHVHGSNNPNGVTAIGDRYTMHPFFTFKDLVTIFLFLLALSVIVFFYPNLLGQIMAVFNSNIIYNNNTMCWNNINNYSTHIVSICFIISNKVKMNNNIASNRLFSIFNFLKEAKSIESAGNLLWGSSETTRVNTLQKNKIFFFNWLAGLIDGGGSLLVNKNGYATIEITLHEKDIKTLYKIKKLLQGKVNSRVKTKAYRWRINNYKLLLNIYINLNSKILSEDKYLQLCKFYIALKNNYNSSKSQQILEGINQELTIPKLSSSVESSIKSGWLSGFIDAEGYFSIRNKYTLTISISQKNKLILEKIQEVIKIGNISLDTSNNVHSLVISDLQGIKYLLSYFNQYPLQTSKHIDCVTFRRLVLFIERKYHLDKENSKTKIRIDNLIRKFQNRYKI